MSVQHKSGFISTTRLAWVFTALSIAFWGGSASAFKIALQFISPLTLLWCGSLISLLVILFILLARGKTKFLLKLSARQWIYLLSLGAINPFLYYVILFEAYNRLPGQVAMSLNYLWPVMLALLSVPILKHTLTLRAMVSIILSFSGAMLIATRGSVDGWLALDPVGIFLALASTIVWALYWLLSARLTMEAEVKLFIGFLSGAILTSLYAFYQNRIPAQFNDFPWFAIAYVGLFEMGITFFVWLSALQLADNTARVGNMIYLTPFLSLLLLGVILDEAIHITTLLGLVIIIFGIILQRMGAPATKSGDYIKP